eukprot:CAMPEP_0198262072 /NCGR_PEP_ID=MMETSP1447-20131203/10638_1 /TAXON_ID=420782 /ORGANISM="Chaetoceros dichaeta, Strain CCMP1751" /LENGTH=504 /DNA_ID=CAMNT_0043950173 /DNA_START=149 /DNA_END=1662 /DNA_ORIENTATION=+
MVTTSTEAELSPNHNKPPSRHVAFQHKYKGSSDSGAVPSASLQLVQLQQQQHDLEDGHNNPVEERHKLQNLLTDLGLSMSKWRIFDNNRHHRTNSTSASATHRRRTRNRRRQVDVMRQHRRQSLVALNNDGSNTDDDDIDIDDARMRVQSIHAAQTVNLVAVLTKVFGGSGAASQNQIPLRHVLGRTSVIVELPPPVVEYGDNDDGGSIAVATSERRRRARPRHRSVEGGRTDSISLPSRGASNRGGSSVLKGVHPRPQPRFVAIFRFGSVVFFNIPSREANTILKQIKKHGFEPISQGFERKESFEVVIRPSLEETARVNGDFVTVKDLNMNSVAVISTIMAQTVVLDSYNDTVDELLATFASINSTVKRTGNFTDMERESLFKVVAQNNSLFIDMISKLGIKDRSDTAWNLSQYELVHEGMKDEFEIDGRFEHIEFKLNLIQQNAKFFLEILQSQKSNALEWIIIVLIAFECVLMILDMSGIGSTILGTPIEHFQPEQKPTK